MLVTVANKKIREATFAHSDYYDDDYELGLLGSLVERRVSWYTVRRSDDAAVAVELFEVLDEGPPSPGGRRRLAKTVGVSSCPVTSRRRSRDLAAAFHLVVKDAVKYGINSHVRLLTSITQYWALIAYFVFGTRKALYRRLCHRPTFHFVFYDLLVS